MTKVTGKMRLMLGGWGILVIAALISCMQLDSTDDPHQGGSSLINSSSSALVVMELQMGKRHDSLGISYYQAIMLCNELSITEGLDTLYKYDEPKEGAYFWLPNIKVLENRSGYRLPTKEEWMFAKDSSKITDYDEDIGEWIYSKSNSNYGYDKFDLAPKFETKVLGYKLEGYGYSTYGMRPVKVIITPQ